MKCNESIWTCNINNFLWLFCFVRSKSLITFLDVRQSSAQTPTDAPHQIPILILSIFETLERLDAACRRGGRIAGPLRQQQNRRDHTRTHANARSTHKCTQPISLSLSLLSSSHNNNKKININKTKIALTQNTHSTGDSDVYSQNTSNSRRQPKKLAQANGATRSIHTVAVRLEIHAAPIPTEADARIHSHTHTADVLYTHTRSTNTRSVFALQPGVI